MWTTFCRYLNLGRAAVLRPSGSCSAGPDTLNSSFCEKNVKNAAIFTIIENSPSPVSWEGFATDVAH